MDLAAPLSLLFALICISAFCSSAETALFSLSPVQLRRIQHDHPEAGRRVRALLDVPTHLLSTILIANTIVNVVASVVGYEITSRLVPNHAELVSIAVMTLLVLVFGEVAPKRFAMRWAERMAPAYAPLLRGLIVLLTPARLLLQVVCRWFEVHIAPRPKHLTEDEFLSVVGISEEEGVLDEEERTMVDGIVRLEEIRASDVMTPRVDLVGINLDDDPSTYLDIARNAKVHFLPLYRESLDNIVGILDAMQYILLTERRIESASVPVSFVPETVQLSTLLGKFQREDLRVVVVADEYGGTAGLVTIGDILEEIVGGLDNEYGDAKLTIEQLGPDRWLIDGSTSLEEINYELDLNLEGEGVDRISGWVSAMAQRIPRTGEVIEAQGCRVTVRRVHRTRIAVVDLVKLAKPADDGEGAAS